MTFDILSVVDADHTSDALYPTIAAVPPCPVTLHPSDGTLLPPFRATSVRVSQLTEGGPVLLGLAYRRPMTVLLTDARLVLFRPSTATSRLLRAAFRALGSTRGERLLAGQVRYPWIAAVGASPKPLFGGAEQLRIVISDGTSWPRRRLALDLTLPARTDSLAAAQEIVHRTAAFWLCGSAELSTVERLRLDELYRAPRLTRVRGAYALYRLPTFCHATAGSGLPAAATG